MGYDAFRITGGTPLYGSVRVGGAKNASVKLMIASLLAEGESRLLNLPKIIDVAIAQDIIQSLGATVTQRGDRTLFIDGSSLSSYEVPREHGPKSRSAPMFVPALLHRFGKAVVPHPGGDKIGKRPLDRHWDGLIAMGALVEDTGSEIVVTAQKLSGAEYRFSKNTHTGTELMIMAAVLAEGTTVLKNAAMEPEVDDLILMLTNMGARIRRRHHKIIEIEGVSRLQPTIHKIMPDRNEAVSYAVAAIATKGDVILENARREHLEAFIEKLDEVGGGYEIGKFGIRFYFKGPLRGADVVTEPHPGFMTDWQPLWAILMTQAVGESVIHEAVHPNRFHYVKHLVAMGATIDLYNPEVEHPDKVYNFDLANDDPSYFHAARIHGPSQLTASSFEIEDLRHGATLVIAALVADGVTELSNVAEIDRGYERLGERLCSMGAKIERVSVG